jgi:serine protease Do
MNTRNKYRTSKTMATKEHQMRSVSNKFALITLFLVLGLTASACSPQAPVIPTATQAQATATLSPTATSTPTLPPTPTEEPSLQVSSLEAVRRATVQILTQGTFLDPTLGLQQLFAGKGSGFIISESGIAITNNHVVTGAAIVEVKLPDEDGIRSARVLGVSECSDLAVIDIEGEGFNYLEWYQEPITVGMPVYAAGFPLGDPEFTLTQGIVSKERANGEVYWASVNYVIEHDANLNPGNSGGPLVTQKGQVVGVNYASFKEADQSFAITRDEAINILEQLSAGNDVDSIGVNGMAISDGEDISGVWISSVRSGSQADDSGIRPGDLITKMEGMQIAQDGTMSAYCDILRSHKPGDILTIEVMRLSENELLKGQINGHRLEVISKIEEDPDSSSTGSNEYVTVTDELEMIEIELPAAWSDVDGSPWMGDGDIFGASIIASPDLDDYYNTWSTPGIWFAASSKLAQLGGYIQVLDWVGSYYKDDCELEGRYSYDDGVYRGKYDVFSNCGGEDVVEILISAVPKDNPTEFLILVDIRLNSDADWEVLDHIVDSFLVVGDLSKMAFVDIKK